MAPTLVSRPWYYTQWTGANESTVVADLSTITGRSITVVSVVGSTLTITDGISTRPVQTNEYVLAQREMEIGEMQNYDATGLAQRFTTLNDSMTGLASTPQFATAVQAAVARSFTNNASRSLTTSTGAAGFQVSATRDAAVGYNITMSTTATIAGGASSTVVLEIAATNSATPGDWVEIARVSNSQTLSLAVTLQSVQGVAGQLSGIIPKGYYAKLRQTNTGTASATYNTGQEVLL